MLSMIAVGVAAPEAASLFISTNTKPRRPVRMYQNSFFCLSC